MEESGVEAILFDLDNTLVDTTGAGEVAIHQVCELLKTKVNRSNLGDICDLFAYKLLKETYEPSAGQSIDEIRINHWHEALQEAEGVDPGHALASDCYYIWKTARLQALTLSPDVLALLKKLRSTYKLLLLTNGEAQIQREKIEALRCEGLFDAMVIGGEHEEQKPAVSIFTYCFELLQMKPQSCIMVGDSLDTDIQGGVNAGVRATVWINNSGTSTPENAVTPDFTIQSVLDLPDVLSKLRCVLQEHCIT